MNNNITKAFNLQGLLLDKIDNNGEKQQIILHCRSPRVFAKCPDCERSTKKIHQQHIRYIKHGLLNQKLVVIKLRVRRFKCKKCPARFTEQFKGIDRRSTTENFRLNAMNWLARNSFNFTGEQFKISPATLNRYLLSMNKDWKINWDEPKIYKLGIDEHSFRGRNLITTITDLSNHKLLTILKNDNQNTLAQFFENMPELAKKQIKEVCIDLRTSYLAPTRKYLPKTEIVADRFHVQEVAKRTLDNVRQIVQTEEGKRKVHLKKLLLTPQEKLDKLELKKLELAFKKYDKYPVLKEAYLIKEKVRQIYWANDKKEAMKRYKHVIMLLETAHRSFYLETLLKTMKHWKHEILNYFDNKTTNGFTEGCHTKIKLIKRVSFGFRNLENYIAKVTLAFLPLIWIVNYHTN